MRVEKISVFSKPKDKREHDQGQTEVMNGGSRLGELICNQQRQDQEPGLRSRSKTASKERLQLEAV